MTNQPDPDTTPKPETKPVKQFTCPECGNTTLPLLPQPDDPDTTKQIYYCLECKTIYSRER